MRTLILSLFFCLSSFFASAQQTQFDRYFTNNTLRIDYDHHGNSVADSIRFENIHFYNNWAGNRTQLIDPFNYGNNLVEVYDSASKILIYSRGYSTLFDEWKTTTDGLNLKSFEETTLIPFPKKSAHIIYKRRMKTGLFTKIAEIYLNPKSVAATRIEKSQTIVLHRGADFKRAVDLTFVAEGYSIADSTKMKEDFQRHARYILECKPYKALTKHINIVGVCSFSKESGITDPVEKMTKETAVGCSFNSLGTDRYLMTTNVWALQNYMESTPTDAVIIICNTDKYGGGGIYNYYATVAANDGSSDFTLIHELGHSLAGLADEYYTSEVAVQDFYPLTVEPWEPNITTMVKFEAKWKDLVLPTTPTPTPCAKKFEQTVGLFEGGGYAAKGIYRPWQNCSMKEIIYDGFCPVCTRGISKMILYYVK